MWRSSSDLFRNENPLYMKRNHMLWMIIGCLIPFLFIFLATLFGITGNWPLLLFIVAMFAIHLFMPMHGGHGSGHKNHSKTSNMPSHEH